MLPTYPVPLRLAIVGPESCGKSTLAAELGAALQAQGIATAWVPEYAREYYAARAYHVSPADILAIARGQLAAEAAAAARGARVLLCDTTVLTCRIWAQVAFGAAEPGLLALDRPQDYALTLLACPDIPWQPDPLRSHPQQRNWLFGLYQQALADAGVTPLLLAGTRQARLAAAWRVLQQWLPQLPNF